MSTSLTTGWLVVGMKQFITNLLLCLFNRKKRKHKKDIPYKNEITVIRNLYSRILYPLKVLWVQFPFGGINYLIFSVPRSITKADNTILAQASATSPTRKGIIKH